MIVINPEHIKRFDAALLDEKPFHKLFDLAVALHDEGISQLDIYMVYEHFLNAIDVDDQKYDWIYEVMDFIWGYPPYTKDSALFSEMLTNKLVEEYRRTG